MLALCEVLGMPVDFVAPAFGFQKNTPYPDNAALRTLIEKQWDVCRQFGASIGFHSGSGKSAENYQVMGQVTGGALEIKTSGRYTYEMGVALVAVDECDRRRAVARLVQVHASTWPWPARSAPTPPSRRWRGRSSTTTLAAMGAPVDVFASPADCRAALEALPPSPEHMFFFEYNFLYVLAAGGRPEKSALGDHTPAGYAQRARFYAISPEARLRFAKRVAAYLVFLAETTGLASPRALCGCQPTPRQLHHPRRDARRHQPVTSAPPGSTTSRCRSATSGSTSPDPTQPVAVDLQVDGQRNPSI